MKKNTGEVGSGPVHVNRDAEHGFLFRIDPIPQSGATVIVVQSAAKPDWDYAFHNAGILLRAEPETVFFQPSFNVGEMMRFRILVNPVRKVGDRSVDASGKPFESRWIGKDVPVPVVDLPKWLERRAEPGWQAPRNSESLQKPPGFEILRLTDIQSGYVHLNREHSKSKGRTLRSARFEGVLRVTSGENFTRTLIKGIGPGKAFGFGLLTVSRSL